MTKGFAMFSNPIQGELCLREAGQECGYYLGSKSPINCLLMHGHKGTVWITKNSTGHSLAVFFQQAKKTLNLQDNFN